MTIGEVPFTARRSPARGVAGLSIAALAVFVAACTLVTQPTASPGVTPTPSTVPPSPSAPPASPSSRPEEWRLVEIASPPRTVAQPSAIVRTSDGYLAVGGKECFYTNPDAADPDRCLGGIWHSADLATWEDRTGREAVDVGPFIYRSSGPEPGLIDVAARDGTIVVLGFRGDDRSLAFRATTWRSVDGGPFESTTTPVVFTDARVEAITANGPGFVVVGAVYGRDRPRAAVWTSADGMEWERVADAPAFDVGPYVQTGEEPDSGRMLDVVVTPSGLVAVGSTCVPDPTSPDWPQCGPAAWTSPDGQQWQRAAVPAGVGPYAPLRSVALSKGRLAAAGQDCGGEPDPQTGAPPCLVSTLASDDEGATWEVYPAPDIRAFGRIAATPGGFLALNYQDGALRAWRSTDGVEWAPVSGFASPSGLLDTRGLDLLVDGDRAVVVGWASTFSAFVAFAIVGPAASP